MKFYQIQFSIFLMAFPVFAHAETLEETYRAPMKLVGPDGATIRQEVILTIVRESTRMKAPFIVIQHGRPEIPLKFPLMNQVRYQTNADYFVSKGYVVVIPTRIGYGLTRGPDVEYTGTCNAKNYLRGMTPIVSETKQTLEFLHQMPFIDTTRGIVVGESFGGVGAVAIASSDTKGILGAINISGGDGGSLDHLDEPCSSDKLKEAFAHYGRSNHIQTLWLYSLNDRFWGEELPKQWFEAFTDAGGAGRFVHLPADKNNGHYIFTRNPSAWHPAFESFSQKLGF